MDKKCCFCLEKSRFLLGEKEEDAEGLWSQKVYRVRRPGLNEAQTFRFFNPLCATFQSMLASGFHGHTHNYVHTHQKMKNKNKKGTKEKGRGERARQSL